MRRETKMNPLLPALSLLCLSGIPALSAQDPTPAAPTTAAKPAADKPGDPAAVALLQQALKFTQSLPAMRCKIEATFVMPEMPEGMPEIDIELPTLEVEAALQSPNRFAVRSGEPFGAMIVSDGKQMLRCIDQFQMYELREAPATLAAMFAGKRDAFELPAMRSLAALLAESGKKGALLDAKQVALLGKVKLDQQECHHLKITDDKLACEVWIAVGDEPWVLRHRPAPQKIDLAALMAGGDDEEGKEGEDDAQGIMPGFDCRYRDHAKDAKKDAFALVPPKDYTKVDDLQQAAMEKAMEDAGNMDDEDVGEDQQGMIKEPPHASVGKPVPPVTFPMLDGSKVELASLKGKVVLLDFWATWCGPCVRGLPKVAEVAGALAEQGVVFLAVNLDEDKETIRKFLDQKKLELRVAMADQKVGEQFGIDGIPHTVIVGRDGVVRAVHVGFGPGSEKKLAKDLQEALDAGKGEGKDGKQEAGK